MYKIRKFIYHIRKISNTLINVYHFSYSNEDSYIQIYKKKFTNNITVYDSVVMQYINGCYHYKTFKDNVLKIGNKGYRIKINDQGLSVIPTHSKKYITIINMNGKKLPL